MMAANLFYLLPLFIWLFVLAGVLALVVTMIKYTKERNMYLRDIRDELRKRSESKS